MKQSEVQALKKLLQELGEAPKYKELIGPVNDARAHLNNEIAWGTVINKEHPFHCTLQFRVSQIKASYSGKSWHFSEFRHPSYGKAGTLSWEDLEKALDDMDKRAKAFTYKDRYIKLDTTIEDFPEEYKEEYKKYLVETLNTHWPKTSSGDTIELRGPTY